LVAAHVMFMWNLVLHLDLRNWMLHLYFLVLFIYLV